MIEVLLHRLAYRRVVDADSLSQIVIEHFLNLRGVAVNESSCERRISVGVGLNLVVKSCVDLSFEYRTNLLVRNSQRNSIRAQTRAEGFILNGVIIF